MHFPRFVLLIVLVTLVGFAKAQTKYQGFVAGVYPFQLELAKNGTSGIYRVSGAAKPIFLSGSCKEKACKYRGKDTAFVVTFDRFDDHVSGEISLGDGRTQAFQAAKTALGSELPTVCNDGKWLRRWDSANEDHVLTLAALPDYRIAGVVFVSSLNTSLSLSGAQNEQGFVLQVKDSEGKIIGSLEATSLQSLEDDCNLEVVLELEGSRQELAFEVTKSLPIGCLSAAGRIDLVYPLTQNVKGDTEMGEVVNSWWQTLSKGNKKEASGWFVPSRLDEHLLSGWMYFTGSAEQTAVAINVDLKTGKSINSAMLLGSRKGRSVLRSESLERAIARHPLNAEPGFEKWVNKQDLKELTIVEEGVVFGSSFHPVYGQLVWTEPWASLPNSKRLPSWIKKS